MTWNTTPPLTGGAHVADIGNVVEGAWKRVRRDVRGHRQRHLLLCSGARELGRRLLLSSSEGANPPQLVLQATAPPDTVPPDTIIDSGPTGSVPDDLPPTSSTTPARPRPSSAVWTAVRGQPARRPAPHADLSRGSHTFEVRATDLAGNTDPTPATRTWTVDIPLETTIDAGPRDGGGHLCEFRVLRQRTPAPPSCAGSTVESCPPAPPPSRTPTSTTGSTPSRWRPARVATRTRPRRRGPGPWRCLRRRRSTQVRPARSATTRPSSSSPPTSPPRSSAASTTSRCRRARRPCSTPA